ncbi:MAG: hypothetical protein IPJ74_09030 [Saprospiraceae bacterium]|nr:hypothetical protein [Saprospiraceae bacterium]
MTDVVQRLKTYIIYEMEGRIVNGEQYLDSPILLDTFSLNPDPSLQRFNIETRHIDGQRFAIVKGKKSYRK